MSEMTSLLTVKPWGHFALESCFKLFLFSDFFSEYEKAVILDADLIVEKDIAELFGTDVSSAYMGACDDLIMKHLLSQEGYKTSGHAPKMLAKDYIADYLELGSSETYYNTGVAVLNLKRGRTEALYEQALGLINHKGYWFLEQDVLNELCGKNTKLLSARWNMLVEQVSRESMQNALGNEKADLYLDSLEHHYILHFAGCHKPWYNPKLSFADSYYRYARQTSWYEYVVFCIGQYAAGQSTVRGFAELRQNLQNVVARVNNVERIMRKKILRRACAKLVNLIFPQGTKGRNLIRQVRGAVRLFMSRYQNADLRKARYNMLRRLKRERHLAKRKDTLEQRNSSSLKNLKDAYKNQRCFIVGTGPSLTVDDLSKLSGEITLSLNSIYKLFPQTEWRPHFYFNNDIMLSYGMKMPQETRLKYLTECLSQYCFDTALISSSDFNAEIREVHKGKTLFLPTIDYLYRYLNSNRPSFGRDCSKKVHAFGTTVYLIFQVAVYMGFKEIYLLGTDCSYSGRKKHAYNSDEAERLLYADDERNKCLGAALRKGFEAIKYYSEKKEVRVFNATRGGDLHYFQRVNLDDVLESSRGNESWAKSVPSLHVDSVVKGQQTVNIGYVTSDEYAQHAGISILSLLENNKSIENMCIYVLQTNLSGENRSKLKEMVKRYDRAIEFIAINDTLNSLLEEHDLSSFKNVHLTYAKIFPELFLRDIDRILMLDADTIINGSLLALYNTALNDACLAGIPELSAWFISSEDPDVIHKNRFYYNSGVLVHDLRKKRENGFTQKMLSAHQQYGKPFKLADQSMLNNGIDSSDILPLPYIYNYNLNLHWRRTLREKTQIAYYEQGLGVPYHNPTAKLPVKQIKIIHYLGGLRPWIRWSFAPLRKEYLRYRKMSPWTKTKMESKISQIIIEKRAKDQKGIYCLPVLGKGYVLLRVLMNRYCNAKPIHG
jgi:lipopolysaccharide biosynthesis glycosyltransferase